MNLKNYILTLILMLFGGFLVDGQSIVRKKDLDKKSQKKYKEAISQSRSKKFDKSLKILNKLLKKEPTFIDGYLRKSGVLYNMGEKEKAIEAIDEAMAIGPEYDADMYFTKGIIQRELRQYDNAAFNFDMYIQRVKEGSRSEKAKTYKSQSEFAHHAINNPVPYQPKKLIGAINTNNSEYIPALTIDGEQMIFTRRVDGQEDLYIANKVDGVFNEVSELTQLNTHQNEGVHTITADGRRIIFTACNRRTEGIGGCDLFTSRITKDGWSIPNNMGPVINTPAWDAQPSLSADGYTLFWSSNRKGGLGGNDLWTSTRTDTSGWSQPYPLSDAINTSQNEESPFIHPDGKTLYFRSNRAIGMGDFDIYYSRYNDSTRMWMPAKNIGYPINTENAEGALSVSLDGATAFFATDQGTGDNGSLKNLDIFTFELYEEARPTPVTFVKAQVTDAVTGNPIVASIEIINLDNKNDFTNARTNSIGKYLSRITSGKMYGFFVSAPGYVFHSEHFSLTEIRNSYDPYILDIQLLKASPPVVDVQLEEEITETILKNIFFETGSADITSQSYIEIDRLTSTLHENSNLKMQIAGHTDNVGSPADNLVLSEKRAKAVVDVLISKGVDRNRLSYVGYGETQPIDTNETPTGRQNNRRTTFKIVK